MRAQVMQTTHEGGIPLGTAGAPVGDLATTHVTSAPVVRWKTPVLLLASDLLALLLAVVAAAALTRLDELVTATPTMGRFVWLLAVLPGAFSLSGLYPAAGVGPVEEMRRILTMVTAFSAGLALMAASLLGSNALPLFSGVVVFWLAACVTVPSGRSLLRQRFARAPWWGRRAIVLGAGKTSELLISRLANHHTGLDLKIACCLDDDARKVGTAVLGVPVAGPIADAPALKRELGVDYAIVAMPGIAPDRLSDIAHWLGTVFQNVVVIPNAFGLTSIGTSTRDAGGVVGIHVRGHLSLTRNRIAKRLFDLVMLVPIGLVSLPLVVLGAMAVFVVSPGNPFYWQLREGYRGRPIKVWKLRTMKKDADAVLTEYLATHPEAKAEWERHFKLAKDPRVLPIVGSLLRRTSIDELPQLLNVLLGQLSLVGPRPFPYYHLEKFDDGFRVLRSSVRPGVTGYWQVTSRSTADLLDQVELDSYYIRNWSLWLDLYITARTPWAVLFGPGAY